MSELSVQHLIDAANNLPSSPSSNILKSYYLTKCRTIVSDSSFDLPQRFAKATTRCPRCSVQYEDANANYSIKPECKQSRFKRRLLKRCNDKNLTRFQERYLKTLTRKDDIFIHNTLVIKCGVCKNEVEKKLKKSRELEPSVNTSIDSHKKKKKKKDRFSGLNKDAVLAANSTPNISYNTSDFIKLEHTPAMDKTKSDQDINHFKRKKLFSQNLVRDKIEKLNNKKQQKKNKEKKLKGLQSILSASKEKSKSSGTLEQFLMSI